MARTVSVKLMADVASFTRNLSGASSSVKTLSGELEKAERAGKLDHVTNAAAGLGLGLVGVAGAAIKMRADFEKQMSAVQAATHAGAGEMASLQKAALDAGKSTAYSATEAGKGIEELSKAGVSTANILGGGLAGALDLASAGSLDVGEAAETAASAMTQFKLSGSAVPHVADLLSAAAGKAQGSVHDMGAALNQAGIVAAGTGLSIEDTTGTLAAFASAGLIGSDAGTSFKTMLQALQAPSGKTKDLMDELGISAYDAGGQFVGIVNFAQQLKDKLSKLTPELRANAMAQIFGSDATRAAGVLYEQGADGIQKWIDKTNDAGYAADTAAIKTDNLTGDIERLKGSLETMAIEGGSGANSGLRVITRSISALVDEFGQLPPAVGGTATVLAGLSGAALLGGVGWLKYRTAISQVTEQLVAMGPAGEKAAAGLGKVRKAAAAATVAFVALEVAGAVFDRLGDAAPNVDKLSAALTNYANTGKVAGELTNAFGQNMEDFKRQAGVAEAATHGWTSAFNDFTSAIPGVGSMVDSLNESLNGTSFNASTAAMSTFDDALVSVMTTTNDAKKASQLWNDTVIRSGLDAEQLAKVLPGAYKKVGELNNQSMQAAGSVDALAGAATGAGEASSGAAKKVDVFTVSTDLAKRSAKGELDALIELADQLTAQIDPVYGLLDAEQKLKTAQDNATEAIRKHGRSSTEAQDATRKLALAAIDLQSKAGALGGTFDGKLTPQMYATLKAGSLTESQIKDVAKQFRDAKKDADKYAGDYKASVSITGAKEVEGKLNRLSVYQQALKAGKIPAGFYGPVKGSDGKYYAEGGWTGPGAKYDEAGIVHADEFVINKESRRKIEKQAPGLLDRMNDTGELGYAAGGRVTWPFRTTAAMTRIPSRSEVAAAVGPPAGATDQYIINLVHSAFPGLHAISVYRPGARTLSGNVSYHSLHRAVDWPASRSLAEWWNSDPQRVRDTKEFISPWNAFNIHNGARHSYTGAIYRQHSGSNAHDHIAMAGGGVINEPVYGYGASGRSYSFGERGSETVVPGTWSGAQPTVVVQGGGADMSEVNARLDRLIGAVVQVAPGVADAMTGAYTVGRSKARAGWPA